MKSSMENKMEIDKAIFDYYKEEINIVKTPPPIIPKEAYKATRDRIYNIVFAAAIVLAFIPLVTGIKTPTALAGRAAEFYEYHKLDTIIPAGLLEINKLVSESLNSGGK